jgi:hypothetical protein
VELYQHWATKIAEDTAPQNVLGDDVALLSAARTKVGDSQTREAPASFILNLLMGPHHQTVVKNESLKIPFYDPMRQDLANAWKRIPTSAEKEKRELAKLEAAVLTFQGYDRTGKLWPLVQAIVTLSADAVEKKRIGGKKFPSVKWWIRSLTF